MTSPAETIEVLDRAAEVLAHHVTQIREHVAAARAALHRGDDDALKAALDAASAARLAAGRAGYP